MRIAATRAHECARRLGALREPLASADAGDVDDSLHLWDRELAALFRDAEALERFTQLYSPADYAPYDPVDVLRQVMAAGTPMDAAARGQLHGDATQVMACIALFRDTVCGSTRSDLDLAVYGGETPRIHVTVTEQLAIPEKLRFADDWSMSWAGFNERWSIATFGGVAERTGDYSASLTLAGDQTPPPCETVPREACTTARALKRSLSSWRNAISNYDPGYASNEDTLRLYARRVEEAESHAKRLSALISAAR
jgi:hypothetical protein